MMLLCGLADPCPALMFRPCERHQEVGSLVRELAPKQNRNPPRATIGIRDSSAHHFVTTLYTVCDDV
eukprot:6640126-Pyramimonas_sp.AAC.1